MADGSDDLDFINKIKASVGDLLPDQKPAIKEPINAKAMEESLGRLGIKRDDPASAEYFRLLDGMAYAHNNVPNRQEPLGWVHALSGAGSAGMLAWAGDSNPQRYSQQFLDNEFKRRSGLESEGTDFVGKFIGPTAQASLTAKIAQQMEALKKNNLAVSMKVKQGKIYNTYAEMENDQRLHPAGTNPAPAGIQRKPAVPVAPKIPGPQQPSMTPSAPSSGLPGTSLDMGGIPQPMPGQPPQAMTPSPTPPAAPPAAVGAPSIAPVAGPGAAPRIGVTTKYDNSVLPPFTVPYSDEDLANAAVYGDDKIADNMRQQNDQARKNYEIEMKKAEQMRLSKEANPEEKASLAEAQKIGEARGEAKVALPKAHEDTLAFLVNSEKLWPIKIWVA